MSPALEFRSILDRMRASPLVAGAWIAFIPLLVLNYLPTLRWMVERWNEDESYVSHGWLIPPISAFLLWSSRVSLMSASGPGSRLGLLLVIPALLLHFVAGLADVSSISGLTIMPLILGFMVLVHGWPMFRAAWFPILFLAFMVPPPEFVISTMNFSLKLVAADTAEWLLNLTGVAAVRQGSFMLFGSERLAIGDVCSGLRSLLSLFALSVLYAWIIRGRGALHVFAALLTAVPAAIIGNGIRICLVCYLVMGLGNDRVFKPLVGSWDLHLLTGAVIFMGAFGTLYLVTVFLEWAEARAGRR